MTLRNPDCNPRVPDPQAPHVRVPALRRPLATRFPMAISPDAEAPNRRRAQLAQKMDKPKFNSSTQVLLDCIQQEREQSRFSLRTLRNLVCCQVLSRPVQEHIPAKLSKKGRTTRMTNPPAFR